MNTPNDYALCVRSFDRPIGDGNFRRFVAGVSYPTAILTPEELTHFFEHPTASPPKGTIRRDDSVTGEREKRT